MSNKDKNLEQNVLVMFAALLMVGVDAGCGHNGCCYCNTQGEPIPASAGGKYAETCIEGCKLF